ncbi:MAG: U32 family peptidase, partial [Bacteroidales bacterium]|nr:U32 family peptidase [Bacteroidales bacterium]
MKAERKEIEIMAPVGNYESLMAAVQAGANSVYFGVEQLNMRAKSANNFELDDLPEIVRICNENNMKSYLAVNTIMYDHDLKVMHMLVDKAKATDVSAIIASDQAILNYAHSVGV